MGNGNASNESWLARAMVLTVLAGAFLSGCPGLEVEDISLVPGSVDGQSFTLQGRVIVIEEDPAVDDNGDLGGGRGILGVWLPPGWEATGARVQKPDSSEFIDLTAVDDGDGHFAPTFPGWMAPGTRSSLIATISPKAFSPTVSR